jgi:hypothetical protein
MSTRLSLGATMRAQVACATSRCGGIPKSAIRRGGIAPPQGLMRPARSSNNTLWPRCANSCAAVAPEGPPPTTTTSKLP